MTLRREAARNRRTSSPVAAPHRAGVPVAPARLGDGDRMRRLGRARLASRSPGGRARCRWQSFWASVMGTTRLTCMIMLILAGASFMSTSMAYTGIPAALAAWVESLELSPYALIAALTVMYILLGTALDGISMIVLTTAVVIPMVKTGRLRPRSGSASSWCSSSRWRRCRRRSASTSSCCRPCRGKDFQHGGAGGAAVLLPALSRRSRSSRSSRRS